MGLVSNVLQRAAIGLLKLSKKDTSSPADIMNWMSGAGWSRSGQYVNWVNSLCITAVMGCVRVISEDIAKVPFEIMVSEGKTVKPAVDHPAHALLRYRPNAWQTPFEFKQMLLASAVLSGNGYAYITRGVDGKPRELLPLPPSCVYTRRPLATWDIRHTISFPNGMGVLEVSPYNMLHLRGMSLDSVAGADIVRIVREALGLAMAGEEHQARLARGGLKQSGYIKTPAEPTKEQLELIHKIWGPEGIGGVANADKMGVVFGGQEYVPLDGSTGKDQEILATRKFQVEEICRAFRVFPQMVGLSGETSTRSSMSEIFNAHVPCTLQPWATLFEETVERDLLTPEEVQNGYDAKINLNDLLRGSPAERGAYYKDRSALFSITPNEVRIREGDNPFEDELYDLPVGPVNEGHLGVTPAQQKPGADPGTPADDTPAPNEDPNAAA